MRRGNYRTDAVVLNTYDFGESDRIIVLFSASYGKLRGVAKGARRSKKRFVGKLDPTSHINMGFFAGGRSELVRVEDAALIDGFNGLRSDIALFGRACTMIELVDEMTREAQVLGGVHRLLVDFLRMLEGAAGEQPAGGPDAVVRYFEIKLLSALGYMPRLGGCMVCGRSGAGMIDAGGAGRVFFSSGRGGMVCAACAPPAASGAGRLVALSRGAASFLAMAERLDGEKLSRLRPGPGVMAECGALLDDFIKYQLGHELKTQIFMEKLRRAPFSPLPGP